jgi:hypothetical protein
MTRNSGYTLPRFLGALKVAENGARNIGKGIDCISSSKPANAAKTLLFQITAAAD